MKYVLYMRSVGKGLSEWKNTKIFRQENGYFYVSLTPRQKENYDKDDLLII
jgi:hypothetical protein